MADRYFYEYGALQERTPEGPKRLIECNSSALDARKIPDWLASKIAAALNRLEPADDQSGVSDEEKQTMLDEMVTKGLSVETMDRAHFLALLDALRRMYVARVMNCCDATAKTDPEWRTLSDVFDRIVKELTERERNEKHV